MNKDFNMWITGLIQDSPRDRIVQSFCENVSVENYTFDRDDSSTTISCTWTLPDNCTLHCFYDGNLKKNQECTIVINNSSNTFKDVVLLSQIKTNTMQISNKIISAVQLPEDYGRLVLKALAYYSFLQLF